jgi:hypothetical protein
MKSKSLKNMGYWSLLAALVVATMPLSARAQNLFFGSDIHGNTSQLAAKLADTTCGSGYEFVGMVGDYGSGTNSTTSDYTTVVSTLNTYASGASQVLTQGNHESSATTPGTLYSHASGPVTLTNNPNFDAFVINYQDYTTINSTLASYLASHTNGKAVVILSHVPLHSTRPGLDQTAVTNIFNTLQTYGDTLDIVFLWGHNHSSTAYDNGVDYVAVPDETIADGTGGSYLNSNASAALNFTYLNAGYINGRAGVTSSYGATGLTITACKIEIHRCGYDAETAVVDRIDTDVAACWPFETESSNVTPELVNGLDATISGTTTPYLVAGKVDLAFNCTSGNYATAADDPVLDVGTGDLTIVAWIKTAQGSRAIVDKRASSGSVIIDDNNSTARTTAILAPNVGYLLYVYGNKLLFQLNDPTNGFYNYYDASGTTLTDNAWHFVAVTVDRDSTTGGHLYVDLTQSTAFNPTNRQGSVANSAPLRIGQHVDGSKFNGLIDELRIWNRALTTAEIQAIYNAEK